METRAKKQGINTTGGVFREPVVGGDWLVLIMRNELVTLYRMDAVAQSLADPIRRRLLLLLREQPLGAGALAAQFSVSRPAVSRHLRVLREAGLVRDEVLGRERRYRLQVGALCELEDYLLQLHQPGGRQPRDARGWGQRFDALATEVQRVRKQRRATRPLKKETA
jgi:DNA-binding transcriptional ArsR family regulator